MSTGAGSYYERFGYLWPDMRAGNLLGAGSFGNVWELLDDEDAGHIEAVKEIPVPPETMGGLSEAKLQGLDIKGANLYFDGMKKCALEEAAMMMKLSSCPNIVRISDYRVCELDGQNDNAVCIIFIRMERLQPLKERLITEGISIGEILQLGIDICTALEECSRYGILHRDVKPENIFCVPGQDVFKLGDFGTAKYVARSTSGKELFGTLSHIAPEVYNGSKFTYAGDLYALGMILYKLLNDNRIPFLPPYPEPYLPEDRDRALSLRLEGAELGLPSAAYSQISSHHPTLRVDVDALAVIKKVSAIAVKAVSPVPEKRFSDAAELRLALEGVKHDITHRT